MKAPFFRVATLIFGLILLGIATLHSSLLILAIPLMAYSSRRFISVPKAIKLMVARQMSHEFAPQGTPITVKLPSSIRARRLTNWSCRDSLPGGVTKTEGKLSAARTLGAQGKIELEYTIEAQRGEYNHYETLISVRDFSGCFEVPLLYRHLAAPDRSTRAIPSSTASKFARRRRAASPGQFRRGRAALASTSGACANIRAATRRARSTGNFRARSERDLYTNIYEQERVADVGIIVDARQRTNVVTASGSLFDHSVRAAASLAENFLDDGNRVSLLIYGSGLLRVFPGYGRVQQDLHPQGPRQSQHRRQFRARKPERTADAPLSRKIADRADQPAACRKIFR